MTKVEIVNQIARETGVEATTVSAVVEGFMEEVRAAQIRRRTSSSVDSAPSSSSTCLLYTSDADIPAFKASPEFLRLLK